MPRNQKKPKARGALMPATPPRLIHRFKMVQHYEQLLLEELGAVINAGPDALVGAVAEEWRAYWKMTNGGQEIPEIRLLALRTDIDIYLDRAKRVSALLNEG
jgi:hypothetical protein